jgi:hypothetical protein
VRAVQPLLVGDLQDLLDVLPNPRREVQQVQLGVLRGGDRVLLAEELLQLLQLLRCVPGSIAVLDEALVFLLCSYES